MKLSNKTKKNTAWERRFSKQPGALVKDEQNSTNSSREGVGEDQQRTVQKELLENPEKSKDTTAIWG